MDKVFVGGLFILYALTLLAIHRWIYAMPARLWGIARAELGRAGEEDAVKAERALQQAADRQARALLTSLRDYHDAVAAQFRAGAVSPDRGATPAPRHGTDTAGELAAATALVAELRTVLEKLLRVRAGGAELPSAASEGRPALPSAAADEDEPEDEPTQVASRPAPRLLAVAGGGSPSR
jgi:hypothetical protein